jgi:hypothetical protein
MAAIKNTSSKVRRFFRKLGNIAFIAFGFLLIFFTAGTKMFGSQASNIMLGHSVLGSGVAHADAPVEYNGGSGGSDSGTGGCSGDCSGSGTGCSGSADGAGDGE